MTPLVDQPGTFRPMLRLAVPVLLEQVLIMMVGFVDLWLAGRYLAEQHLAATSLMSYMLWFIPSLFSVIGIGSTALVARFTGAGDQASVRRVTNQSLTLGLFAAMLVTGSLWVFGRQLIETMQLESDSSDLALQYIRIITPSLPFLMVLQIGVACLRGVGDMVCVFTIMALVNLVNVVVGFTTLTGWWIVPELGWSGLAIGTAAGYVVGGVATAFMLLVGRSRLVTCFAELKPDLALQRRILRIGIPGGADVLAICLCHLWFLAIVNSLGNRAAAAHGISIRLESLAYLPGAAFQVAAATLAGQYLGAGNERKAVRSVIMALLTGGALMTLAGVVLFTFAPQITAFFLRAETMGAQSLAIQLVRMVSLVMPPLALAMILAGGLRGAGDTRWPLLITLVGFLGLRIPLACYLSWGQFTVFGISVIGQDRGVQGAWIAMVIDVILRSILIGFRFFHGGWRSTKL